MTRAIFLSLLLVLGVSSAIALAAENTEKTPAAEEQEYGSVEERRLLLALQQERINLVNERESVAKQKKDLKRLEAEVDKKLDQLQTTRLEIEQLLAEKDAAELQRIRDLSKMYEKMSPDKAAKIFSTITEDLAISILGNMKTKAAAKILNNMDRDKAAKLTTAFSSIE